MPNELKLKLRSGMDLEATMTMAVDLAKIIAQKTDDPSAFVSFNHSGSLYRITKYDDPQELLQAYETGQYLKEKAEPEKPGSNEMTMSVRSGMDFTGVARTAVGLAKVIAAATDDILSRVSFTFSAKEYSLTQFDDPEALKQKPSTVLASDWEAAKARQQQSQQEMDALLKKLGPAMVHGSEAVVVWLKQYIDASDTGGDPKPGHVRFALTTAGGYSPNEFAVSGQEVGENMKHLGSRDKAARFVIGQFLSAMEDGLPPGKFAYALLAAYDKAYPVPSGAKAGLQRGF